MDPLSQRARRSTSGPGKEMPGRVTRSRSTSRQRADGSKMANGPAVFESPATSPPLRNKGWAHTSGFVKPSAPGGRRRPHDALETPSAGLYGLPTDQPSRIEAAVTPGQPLPPLGRTPPPAQSSVKNTAASGGPSLGPAADTTPHGVRNPTQATERPPASGEDAAAAGPSDGSPTDHATGTEKPVPSKRRTPDGTGNGSRTRPPGPRQPTPDHDDPGNPNVEAEDEETSYPLSDVEQSDDESQTDDDVSPAELMETPPASPVPQDDLLDQLTAEQETLRHGLSNLEYTVAERIRLANLQTEKKLRNEMLRQAQFAKHLGEQAMEAAERAATMETHNLQLQEALYGVPSQADLAAMNCRIAAMADQAAAAPSQAEMDDLVKQIGEVVSREAAKVTEKLIPPSRTRQETPATSEGSRVMNGTPSVSGTNSGITINLGQQQPDHPPAPPSDQSHESQPQGTWPPDAAGPIAPSEVSGPTSGTHSTPNGGGAGTAYTAPTPTFGTAQAPVRINGTLPPGAITGTGPQGLEVAALQQQGVTINCGNSTPQPMFVACPEYRGDTSFRDWIARFEIACDASHVTGEARLVQLPAKLATGAMDAWETLALEDRTDYARAKRALELWFRTPRTRFGKSRLRSWEDMKRKAGISTAAFFLRVTKSAKAIPEFLELDPKEQDDRIMNTFICGLNTPWAEQVEYAHPESAKDALRIAQEREQVQRRRWKDRNEDMEEAEEDSPIEEETPEPIRAKPRRAAAAEIRAGASQANHTLKPPGGGGRMEANPQRDQPPEPDPQTVELMRTLYHQQQQMGQVIAEIQAQGRTPPANSAGPPQGYPGPPQGYGGQQQRYTGPPPGPGPRPKYQQPSTDGPPATWIASAECFNCGQVGHLSAQCPLPPRNRRPPFNNRNSRRGPPPGNYNPPVVSAGPNSGQLNEILQLLAAQRDHSDRFDRDMAAQKEVAAETAKALQQMRDETRRITARLAPTATPEVGATRATARLSRQLINGPSDTPVSLDEGPGR